ncbi:MAG TPA: gluconate 2-dehydrogenase subunit 3 family protein, partial [Solirubrobacteraceae bacterium]|nr:gluconate 2-dehydrogenase subunit 3 family protein [Solirubrobacteraceae bacterium]
MRLTARQRRALEEICDAFCPSGDGLPSARELGVPGALVEAIAKNPRAIERRQLAALLAAWDTPPLGALGGVGWKRFSSLPREQREQALLGWADSRLPQRRAVFQALRKGALLFYYMLPAAGGAPNPAWDAIGYDGPLGPLPDAAPKALRPSTPDRDTALECDVVIVGSGAGGGAAAGVLAGAGLDVIVVEAGDYYDDQDFDGSEVGALTRFYMGAPNASHDQSVALIAGSCLGGGTVVNYTTSFRTPDDVRAEWASHG